jgi:hypothetical protein
VKCSECGHENLNTTKYCTRCGQTLGGAAGGAGQVRKTVAVDSAFDAPHPTAPLAPPIPSLAKPSAPVAGGQVRRTILEDGPSAGAFPPSAQAPAAVRPPGAPGAPPSMARRTILDEGPMPSQPAAPGAPAQAQASPGTARVIGWMVSYDRNAAGQDYAIRAGRNTIGRGRDNDISIFFEPKASDTHATILWRNGNAAVIDENSTNGTIVNGEDIGIGKSQALQTGDTLTVGGSTFLIFLVDARLARGLWPTSPWAS